MGNHSDKKFYSKAELEEFRGIINTKLDDARNEHKRLANSLKEFSSSSADSINFTEFGNESREKEQVEILMARQAKFIDKLEKALIRIENGSYGICRVTGELIPAERLRVVPHATTTVQAKLKQNKNGQKPNR
ncbi:TraR/DksA C4-type zinc finger protein [Pontibacter sp. G13]|uniref:TraR/DksA family transcriptional regulator n=1 Tax=Pontibacter sp. G13 TaxID=3074898 RepID=UPI0028899DBF|nr:TraR/DksA C4-type zinc finger protein [Pontibacter sp. G13]WNJ21431.1 TraR/DksA C4-type zinc finger protein [Pontibacter sp. G13]